MTGLDALKSVQYVSVKGERYAVVGVDDWEALIEWLETREDTEIATEAHAQLAACKGDRERAGWLRWDDIRKDLE